MSRIELSARTGATVSLMEDFLPDGAPVAVVVIKQRYVVEGRALGAVPGAEIRRVDMPWDEDAPGSPRLPSDVALAKPGTDVVVSGYAVARDEAPTASLDVFVEVGPVARALRVTGTRVWYESLGAMRLTPPEPFTRVPLSWELAWGGRESDPVSGRYAEDARNPYGRGVHIDPRSLKHRPGPQIEDPADPVLDARTGATPAGVAATTPLMRHRRAYAGTMDARWERERMPLRPSDFDLRFYQCAAPGLATEAPLVGGERVRMMNLSPDGPMEFELPRTSFAVWGRADAGRVAYRAPMDTVLLLPTERAVEVVWRARVPIPPGALGRLRAVQVVEREVIR